MDMYLLQAFCWKRTELFEGYEPNVAPIAMEGTSKRSSSVPADSSGLVTGGNPFYSQKVQQEFMLQAARPSNLPSPSSNLEPLTSGQKSGGNPMVENPTGKGRGSSNYEVRQSLSFETPPSKLPPPPTEGKSAAMMSEGVMKEPESALKSMGPVKGVADSSVPGMGEDQLQRALEGELVSFLREQNSKLMNDLEEMKQRLAGLENSKGDSSMSWSEVGAPSMGSLDEQPRARRRRGSRTPPPRGKSPMVCKESMSPRRARSMGLDVDQSCLRCTPNGTKVPEGPPPPCDDVSTGLPQPPPVPPFPVGIEGPRNGEFSPRAARAMWLEREAHCMKGALDRQVEGNPIKESISF